MQKCAVYKKGKFVLDFMHMVLCFLCHDSFLKIRFRKFQDITLSIAVYCIVYHDAYNILENIHNLLAILSVKFFVVTGFKPPISQFNRTSLQETQITGKNDKKIVSRDYCWKLNKVI